MGLCRAWRGTEKHHGVRNEEAYVPAAKTGVSGLEHRAYLFDGQMASDLLAHLVAVTDKNDGPSPWSFIGSG